MLWIAGIVFLGLSGEEWRGEGKSCVLDPCWGRKRWDTWWDFTGQGDWRGGEAKGHQASKGKFMAVNADNGARLNHSGDSALGCAVDALESPREKSSLIIG